MGRRVLIPIAAVLLAVPGVAWAQAPETVESADIPNYRRLRPGLATGGQPSPATRSRS